jgi:hypothetical protein
VARRITSKSYDGGLVRGIFISAIKGVNTNSTRGAEHLPQESGPARCAWFF